MSIRKSILITFCEKYLTLAISFVGIMLISRLLTPKEIGIYSVASAVTGIAQMLRDFGVGNYLIQERELTKDRIRAALSVTCVTSWSAGALLYFARSWVAEFYREPGLEDLIAIQCLNFLLLPFSAPVLALMRRDLQFGVLLRINLLSCITQFVVSVSLAISGYGYLSMAWASVANLVCTVLLVSANRPRQAWLLPGFKEWRRIANFGVQSSAAAIITEIAMSMNDLVLGRFLGFQAVALYSRAQGLIYLFHRDMMDAVRKVAFPAFAQAVREDKDLLKAYLLSVNYVTVFAWPFYAFLGLYTQEIIRLMFGDQWDAAAPLVKILVFAGAVGALWNLATNAVVALGKINSILRSELIVQSMRLVMVLFAASVSVELTCYALVVTYILNLLVTLRYLRDSIGLTLSGLIISNINSFLIALLSMILPVLSFYYLPDVFNLFQQMAINSTLLLLGWLLAILVVPHPIRQEINNILSKLPI
ncbi:lipopolysaccharide biosynthesis protein [Methylomonas methanica]|uniref:Polysaccharide biosynthesis protein n=1 Tax=Methylomonas methanica (strain DSM 25384 / MC09) TaxID=857087 RepID=F9ZWG4_METMM|nr:lipopolysaccharide biosynthesis protein [Methylomonas methanica]AEF99633.1 polysaccharide biosynthesis protein [Methylomonas methanica MC09]